MQGTLLRKPSDNILRDDLILLKTPQSNARHPALLRRIERVVTVDGREVVIVSITNNSDWAAGTGGELYQTRWGIDVFF